MEYQQDDAAGRPWPVVIVAWPRCEPGSQKGDMLLILKGGVKTIGAGMEDLFFGFARNSASPENSVIPESIKTGGVERFHKPMISRPKSNPYDTGFCFQELGLRLHDEEI